MTISANQPLPPLDLESIQGVRAVTEFLTPGSGDFSVALLDRVFGPGWQYLATTTAEPQVGGFVEAVQQAQASGHLFAELMGALNNVALAGLVVFFVFIMATGVLGTAHEGEPLGKRYSTLWMPLRAGLSVGMLIPLSWSGGYSLLQTILLLCTYYGIGGANVVNAVAMEHLKHNQGIVFEVSGNADAKGVIAGSLNTATLLSTLARENTGSGRLVDDVVYWSRWVEAPTSVFTASGNFFRGMLGMETDEEISSATKTSWAQHIPGDQPCVSRGRSGHCQVIYVGPESMQVRQGGFGASRIICDQPQTKLCENRLKAWAQAQKDSFRVAEAVTQPISEENPLQAQRGYFDIMRRNYAALLQQAGSEQLRASNSNRSDQIRDLGDSITRMGWASLGAYYLKISHINEDTADLLSDLVKTEQTGPDLKVIFDGSLAPADLTANLANVGIQMANAARANEFDFDPIAVNLDPENKKGVSISEYTRGSAVGEKNELWALAEKLDMFNPVYGALKGYVAYLTSGDPASNLSTVGHGLLDGIVIGVSAFYATRAIGKSAEELTDGVPLVGRGVKAVSGWISSIWEGPSGLLLSGLLITLLLSAIMLAFYLPLVPFVLWLFGILGWFVLVIEVIVAAPLWAVSHGLPEGEGFAGNHGKQGYMLFLRVLLRPALMVIGFYVAMVAFNIIGGFIGEGFLLAYNSNVTLTGLFAVTANIAILTIICVMATHKIYSLITWLPDNLLNWIGQNHVSLGEGQSEMESRNLVLGAVQRIQGATTQAFHTDKMTGRDKDGAGKGNAGDSGDENAGVDVAADRGGRQHQAADQSTVGGKEDERA